MHNLLPQPQLARFGWAATPRSGNVGSALAITDETFGTGGRGKADPAANGTQETEAEASLKSWASRWLNARTVILLLWLAGACTLASHIIASHIRLRRIIRREPPVINRWIHRLLRDCQKRMDIKRSVAVIVTDSVSSPALFGCLRPRLLLPKAAMADLNVQELRHIFLHELAHLRRDDIVVAYLAALLHVLHWFNPLIALAFKRMRADREMVCDGLALSVLPPEETIAYARTVVHQLEQSLASRPSWVLAALSGDKARIKQRIAMISEFRKQTFRRSPLAMLLVGCLACVGLTDGFAATETWEDYARREFRTTHQDEHAFIERVTIRNRDTGDYLVVKGGKPSCEAARPGVAGLWEVRFDTNVGHGDPVYFYSVAAKKYLASDDRGNLAVDRVAPDVDARWIVWARPQGAWVISEKFKDGYLRHDEQGWVSAVNFGRNARGYWDTTALWRVKTADSPKGTADWHRQHVPGPD